MDVTVVVTCQYCAVRPNSALVIIVTARAGAGRVACIAYSATRHFLIRCHATKPHQTRYDITHMPHHTHHSSTLYVTLSTSPQYNFLCYSPGSRTLHHSSTTLPQSHTIRMTLDYVNSPQHDQQQAWIIVGLVAGLNLVRAAFFNAMFIVSVHSGEISYIYIYIYLVPTLVLSVFL